MAGLHGLGLTQNWFAFFAPNGNGMMLLMVFLGFLIVYFLPNTEQIMDKVHPALEWEKWRSVDPAPISLYFSLYSHGDRLSKSRALPRFCIHLSWNH